MVGSKIIEKSYRLTNRNATTFLDGNATNIMAELNIAYGHRILDILRVRVDRNATMQNATTDLLSTVGLTVGDSGFNGEYAFPANLLKPVRAEISYDGLTWNKATIYDNAINQGSEYNDSQVNSEFSTSSPMIDFMRNSYKIRPLKTTAGNITKGIYIEYEKRQVDFTTSTEPTEIESNLQDILSYDLAEQEILMHSKSYDSSFVTIFYNKKNKVEALFDEFYKNGLPLNLKATINYPNYR
jgi:hypothetical protein